MGSHDLKRCIELHAAFLCIICGRRPWSPSHDGRMFVNVHISFDSDKAHALQWSDHHNSHFLSVAYYRAPCRVSLHRVIAVHDIISRPYRSFLARSWSLAMIPVASAVAPWKAKSSFISGSHPERAYSCILADSIQGQHDQSYNKPSLVSSIVSVLIERQGLVETGGFAVTYIP